MRVDKQFGQTSVKNNLGTADPALVEGMA